MTNSNVQKSEQSPMLAYLVTFATVVLPPLAALAIIQEETLLAVIPGSELPKWFSMSLLGLAVVATAIAQKQLKPARAAWHALVWAIAGLAGVLVLIRYLVVVEILSASFWF